jgi:hypothetical protein
MAEDLIEARREPLFDAAALTELLWAPRSRDDIDQLVHIIEKEPIFKKTDK